MTVGSDPTLGLEIGLNDLVSRDQRAIACPYPIFSELRDKSPVHFSDKLGAWVCTRYDDILAVLHDTDRFSSRLPTGPSPLGQVLAAGMEELRKDPAMAETYEKVIQQRAGAAVLLNADPPEHVRQRKAVNGAFRPARLRGMEPMIEAVTDRLLDKVAPRGEMDAVADFAVGLPMTIIAYALGVSEDDLDTFKRWSDDIVMPVGKPNPTPDEVRAYLISQTEFADFFSDILAQRKRDPQEDVISDVALAEVDGVSLSEPEMLSMLSQFLVAGNETTTKLLTNLVLHLATDDGLEARLRDDRSLIEGFVEEGLRYEAPVSGLFRQAKVDLEIGGQQIHAGDHVWVIYASANRDGERFSDPDAFDVTRENVRDHLAFGHGEHYCIGAQLARSEAQIAVNKILDRLENIRLASLQREFDYGDTFVLRGLEALLVEFDAR